ncbi:MAG: hypothetical protein ISR58_14945 [Anaerolineales bacterium]|nr:hypothetical protein [Chloroflexota bacterium]MBL6982474.1 hypothetical protein [Anaerolineales bacterium]
MDDKLDKLMFTAANKPHSERIEFVINNLDDFMTDEADAALSNLIPKLKIVPSAEFSVLQEILRAARQKEIMQVIMEHFSDLEEISIEWVNVFTEDALGTKREYFRKNPKLISNLSITALNNMIIEMQREGNAAEVDHLHQHLIMLIECRKYGVEKAFKKLILRSFSG